MFQRRPGVDRNGRITGAKAIASVASPVRQELLDTIETLGGSASVGELAVELGRPADGLYYHVQVLVRAGLLVDDDRGTTDAGRDEQRFRVPSDKPLAIAYRPASSQRAVRGVTAGMLRIAKRDFDTALADDRVVVDGPRRELWAARGTGWVSDAELADINRLLAELAGRLRHRRADGRDRLVSVCFVLAPLVARPKRRASVRPRASAARTQPPRRPRRSRPR